MKKSKKEFVNIRWTIRKDLETIVQIHNQSLPDITTTYLQNLLRDPQRPVSLVAEIKEVIVGYVLYHIRTNRYEIIHLAVDEAFRRMSVGTSLINNIKSKLTPTQEMPPVKDLYYYSTETRPRNRITISVPDHMLHAHLFFRSCNFHGAITDDNTYRFEYKK